MNVLTNINLNKNELQNAVVQNLAAAPANPHAGQIYYNSGDTYIYVYDGTAWKPVGIEDTGLFIADWADSTITYQKVIDALNANKMVLAKKSYDYYVLVTIVAQAIVFAYSKGNIISTLSLKSDNSWEGPNSVTLAPLASPTFTGTPAAPTATAGTNTTQIATTEFVQTAIAGISGALVFKGTVNSASDLPASHTVGWTYIVGTAGSYAGQTCEVGDLIVCINTGTTASNADWSVVQTNIAGAVTGPSSATNNAIALFDGTTGKIIKDSAKTIATSVTNVDTTVPTSKAVKTYADGVVKTATGTIATSATTVTVSFTGTYLSSYATMSGDEIVLDKTVSASSVKFTVAAAPSAAVSCVVIYK